METLEQHIVACARGWLGTRFHHQGRLKHTDKHRGGVDCLGLLVGVARELCLKGRDGTPLAALDRTDYGHMPDGSALRAALEANLYALPLCYLSAVQAAPPGTIPPGSVLLLALDGRPCHLAIATDFKCATASLPERGTGMIHAYAQVRRVVEHTLDACWQKRIAAVYRIPG